MYALCEWRLEDSAYIQDQIRRAVRLAQDELTPSNGQPDACGPPTPALRRLPNSLTTNMWLTAEHAAHVVLALQVEEPRGNVNILRHQPLGEDAGGSRFWFFASQQEDSCLYRSAQGLPLMRCTCRGHAGGIWPPVTAGHRQHMG